jgi:hypothetical protein
MKMKKLYTILLLCGFSLGIHAQQHKHEIGLSWLPVNPNGQPNGFQVSYFRHLRPWYHVGASAFHFGTSESYTYNFNGTGSYYYADTYRGITLTNRFVTAERYRIGAYFNLGLAMYRSSYVSESSNNFPPTPPSFSRFQAKYSVLGNVFGGGVYVKPHQRLKISAGINLFLSWIESDQTGTEVEPYWETGCFDFNVAWQF